LNRLVCIQWYAILERHVTGRQWNRYIQNSQDAYNKMGVELGEIRNILEHEPPSLITERNKMLLSEVHELKVDCLTLQRREDRVSWSVFEGDYLRFINSRRLGKGLWNILLACRNIRVLILDLKNCDQKIYMHPRADDLLPMDNLVTYEVPLQF